MPRPSQSPSPQAAPPPLRAQRAPARPPGTLVGRARGSAPAFSPQGMNFIAGYLILVTKSEEEAFWLLDALVGRILPGTCTVRAPSGRGRCPRGCAEGRRDRGTEGTEGQRDGGDGGDAPQPSSRPRCLRAAPKSLRSCVGDSARSGLNRVGTLVRPRAGPAGPGTRRRPLLPSSGVVLRVIARWDWYYC